MIKIIKAYLKRCREIHENSPIRTDPAWVTKILYEQQESGKGYSTDIERDIIYGAEAIEPDRKKWGVLAKDYKQALAELARQYPKMQGCEEVNKYKYEDDGEHNFSGKS